MFRKFKRRNRASDVLKSSSFVENRDQSTIEDDLAENQSVCAVNTNNNETDDKFSTLTSSRYSKKSGRSTNEQSEEDNMSMLDGNVHLDIELPSGTKVQVDVEAKTEMMDILVKVCLANGINPGGMYLKASCDRTPGYMHYKPSTAIGRLNCQQLFIVPKSQLFDRSKSVVSKKSADLPFEPTTLLSIDLPRGQKTFLRVNPDSSLSEVVSQICQQTCSAMPKKLGPSDAMLCLPKRKEDWLDQQLTVRQCGVAHFVLKIPEEKFRRSSNDIPSSFTTVADGKFAESKSRGFFSFFKKKEKKHVRKSSMHSSVGNLHAIHTSDRASIQMHANDCASTLNQNSAVKKRPAPQPPKKTSEFQHVQKSVSTSYECLADNITTGVRQDSDTSSGYCEDAARQTPSPAESSTKSAITRDSACVHSRASTDTEHVAEDSKICSEPATESNRIDDLSTGDNLDATEPLLISDLMYTSDDQQMTSSPVCQTNGEATAVVLRTLTSSTPVSKNSQRELTTSTKRKSHAPLPPTRLDSMPGPRKIVITRLLRNDELSEYTMDDLPLSSLTEGSRQEGSTYRQDLCSIRTNNTDLNQAYLACMKSSTETHFESDYSLIGNGIGITADILVKSPENAAEKLHFSSPTCENGQQSEPSTAETIVYRDHPEKDLYPSMPPVKSFEDEFFFKDTPSTKTGHVSSNMRAASFKEATEVAKRLFSSTNDSCSMVKNFATIAPACAALTLQETNLDEKCVVANGSLELSISFDDLASISVETLSNEYKLLLELFNEWQALTAANAEKSLLSTLDMLQVQRLQTKVLEHHQTVQEMCDVVYGKSNKNLESSVSQKLSQMSCDLSKFDKQSKVSTRKPIELQISAGGPAKLVDVMSEMKQKKLKPVTDRKAFGSKDDFVSKITYPDKKCQPMKDVDSKEELLLSIRRFGGVDGLKKVPIKSSVEAKV